MSGFEAVETAIVVLGDDRATVATVTLTTEGTVYSADCSAVAPEVPAVALVRALRNVADQIEAEAGELIISAVTGTPTVPAVIDPDKPNHFFHDSLGCPYECEMEGGDHNHPVGCLRGCR